MFVFATETCAACPLRAQCTRGRGGRTVHVHPQEALLQQARAFQKSPAFGEVRPRRQVVEHRIARLVQLGIRQARGVGRAKTLFQVCLAAAVANLTLLATTSLASARTEDLASCWLTLVVVGGVLSTFGLAATHSHQAAHSSHLLHTMLPTISRQLPPSRPGS